MQTILLITQGLLGLVFLFTGGAKLAGSQQMKDDFDRFGYSSGFRLFTGFLEVTGAAFLLAGYAWPGIAAGGGILLVAVMGGALWTHLARVGDPFSKALPPLVLGALALWVTIAHWPA